MLHVPFFVNRKKKFSVASYSRAVGQTQLTGPCRRDRGPHAACRMHRAALHTLHMQKKWSGRVMSSHDDTTLKKNLCVRCVTAGRVGLVCRWLPCSLIIAYYILSTGKVRTHPHRLVRLCTYLLGTVWTMGVKDPTLKSCGKES